MLSRRGVLGSSTSISVVTCGMRAYDKGLIKSRMAVGASLHAFLTGRKTHAFYSLHAINEKAEMEFACSSGVDQGP